MAHKCSRTDNSFLCQQVTTSFECELYKKKIYIYICVFVKLFRHVGLVRSNERDRMMMTTMLTIAFLLSGNG